jgi:peptidoglycan/LPS O-acetylase OafA/YrhL
MARAGTEPLRTWPFRYEIIDGLRGLAALAVVMQHLGVAAVGHYAVMLFFVISGYCITASAEVCRQNGASFGSFMLRRLRRIYPPYWCAILFYVLTRLAKISSGAHNDLARPWLDWLQNLTLTQWLWLPAHPVVNAAQNPKLFVTVFWSLNYEEQFYLVMAVGLWFSVRRRLPIVALVLSLAAAGLLWNLTWPDGWITGFFIEYWLHFALGAVLFYALCKFPDVRVRRAFVAFVAVVGLYCVLQFRPWFAGPDPLHNSRAYVELATASAFTLALFFLRPASPWLASLKFWRPIAALGTISYSLYLVHQFNLTLVQSAVDRIVPHAWNPVRLGAMLGLQILVATAFWYLCERPFLNRSSARKASAAGQTSEHVEVLT